MRTAPLRGETLTFTVKQRRAADGKRARTATKDTVLTISSNGDCEQEHTYYTSAEACDDDSMVGSLREIEALGEDDDMEVMCENQYGAKQMQDFLKSIDKHSVTLRLARTSRSSSTSSATSRTCAWWSRRRRPGSDFVCVRVNHQMCLLKLNLAVSVVVLAILSYLSTPPRVPMGGFDSDDHGGCKSCGFSWCEAKRKCVRPWEEPASSPCAA